MPHSAQLKVTHADLVTAPEHLIAEIIDGHLVTRRYFGCSDGKTHASQLACLARSCSLNATGLNGWTVFSRPELHIGDHVVVPDIAAWRQHRCPDLQWSEEIGIKKVPDWVGEISSPNNPDIGRRSAWRIYVEHGVKHLWLVEPLHEQVDCLEPRDGAWHLRHSFKGDTEIVASPFTDPPIDARHLWWRNIVPRKSK